MRGLQTTVRMIRRRVFTEVAKLGFKANAETLIDDMEAIPYEIVTEDQDYRDSCYRARAVVRERLRLAWDYLFVQRINLYILHREWKQVIFRKNIMSHH